MKAKRCKVKRGRGVSLKQLITAAGKCVRGKGVVKKVKQSIDHPSTKRLIRQSLVAVKKALNNKKIVRLPRIISLPKTGGVLPLIPIFAGLSALGTLTGGVAGIVKTLNETKHAREQLNESQRHNRMMEAVAIRRGEGLYLKPYKTGLGLFMNVMGKKKRHF